MSAPFLNLVCFPLTCVAGVCWSPRLPHNRSGSLNRSVGAFFPFQFHCFLFFSFLFLLAWHLFCPFPPLGAWVFPLSKYIWLAVSPALSCCALTQGCLSLCCRFLTRGYLDVYCSVFRILEMFLVVFLALIQCPHSKEYTLYNFSIPPCPILYPAWTQTHAS